MVDGLATLMFKMQVLERIAAPDGGGVVLAGPVVSGAVVTGSTIVLHEADGAARPSRCAGLELLNWGADRSDWVSLRVTGFTLDEVQRVTSISA
jgi:hypothetical protein